MSLSEIVIKLIGVILALAGLLLLLSVVGLNVAGIGIDPWPIALVVGALMIGAGIWIIRGGTITA